MPEYFERRPPGGDGHGEADKQVGEAAAGILAPPACSVGRANASGYFLPSPKTPPLEYNGASEGWMGTTQDLLATQSLHSHWLDPKLCTLQEKGDWKELVYEAVEGAEDGALRARFAAMTGASAARYARVKNWDKTESEFAVLSGETGRRGAQVIEPYLDDRAEHVGTRLKLMCRLGCLPTMERVAREEKLPPR